MPTRDVKTGRLTRAGVGAGKHWKAHENDSAWWAVSCWECSDTCSDGHTHEVCLFNISRCHCSPTWPILGCFSAAEAAEWDRKLRRFAKTLEADNNHDHYDKAVNGDARLAAWLTENGWVRHNHYWWVLAKHKKEATDAR